MKREWYWDAPSAIRFLVREPHDVTDLTPTNGVQDGFPSVLRVPRAALMEGDKMVGLYDEATGPYSRFEYGYVAFLHEGRMLWQGKKDTREQLIKQSHMSIDAPVRWFLIERRIGPKVDLSRFPHKCRYCGAAGYIGAYAVECSVPCTA